MSRCLRETIRLGWIWLNVLLFFFCFFKACLHTHSSTVYVRIRAAPHCAEFSIKMLWCEDTEECYNICNLDEVTKVPKNVFLKHFLLSVIMSLPIKNENSFQFSPQSRGDFMETSLSVYKHMLTLFQIVWHFCATHQHGGERTDGCIFIWCLQTQTCKHYIRMPVLHQLWKQIWTASLHISTND